MKQLLPYYFVLLMLVPGASLLLWPSCSKSTHVTVTNNVNTDPAITVPKDSVKKYLALGDSYTIGQSVGISDRYPVQTTAILRSQGIDISDPEIIATTGWTTQDLWNAIKDRPTTSHYAVVTLLIGVNNQYQGRSIDEYTLQFGQLLQRSIQLAGNDPKRVVVLSIPDYSVTPFARYYDRIKIAAEIDAFNTVNKQLTDQYGAKYIDITVESRKAAIDPSLIASDSLHFSGKEYKVWSEMLAPMIKLALQ